jgi:signal transduction histidine kinase
MAVAGIGILDRATAVSLDALYLIPLIAITLTNSMFGGIVVAVASASSWALVDPGPTLSQDTRTDIESALLRFAVLAALAILVGGLRAALAHASMSDRRSRDLLSYAGHQLRTPAAAIRSNAEALILAGVPHDREPFLVNVAAESERIGRLVGSLLRISRLDQGITFSVEPIDVGTLCAQESERVHMRVGERIAVDCDTSHADGVQVVLSDDAMREALASLLDNAARHAKTKVEVLLRTDGDALEITVGDDGPGLPRGQEGHAFDRFVVLDGQGGAGLGLPIARMLCEIQDGKLEYQHGRFVMRFPLTVALSHRDRS